MLEFFLLFPSSRIKLEETLSVKYCFFRTDTLNKDLKSLLDEKQVPQRMQEETMQNVFMRLKLAQ